MSAVPESAIALIWGAGRSICPSTMSAKAAHADGVLAVHTKENFYFIQVRLGLFRYLADVADRARPGTTVRPASRESGT